MNRHGILTAAVIATVLSISTQGHARKGWYMDFYGGALSHTDPSTFVHDKPELRAESGTSSLFDLDFGYSFQNGLSLALGFDLGFMFSGGGY